MVGSVVFVVLGIVVVGRWWCLWVSVVVHVCDLAAVLSGRRRWLWYVAVV